MSDLTAKVKDEEGTIPFYPDHVRTEVRVVIGLIVLAVMVGLMGLLLPVGLSDPADPLNTPAHVKPEWYFLALYQLLKFIPKTTGAMLPVIGLIILALWPFIDSKKDVSKRALRIRLAVVIVALIVLIALTIWGEVS